MRSGRLRCGDGQPRPGFALGEVEFEACDDGNHSNEDSCTNDCRLARCGDGFVGADEACDDGNTVGGDSCTHACEIPACGDGLVVSGEACDDGNDNAFDACTNSCARARCGDGLNRALGDGAEECDDGNNDDGDGCSGACLTEACGNGRVDSGEQCDDNNQDDSDTCTNNCVIAHCGDGALRGLPIESPGYEECDDGNDEALDRCYNCRTTTCGDLVVQTAAGEICDDGNDLDDDSCTNTCLLARCGDGILRSDLAGADEGFEACDDGNEANDDSCLNTCVVARCGDAVLRQGVERCDDGNRVDDDDCSNTCGSGFVELAGGPSHMCARLETGQVACWGYNHYGAVGDGTTTLRLQPVTVPEIDTAVQLTASTYRVCVLLADASIRCWGSEFRQAVLDQLAARRWRFVALAAGRGPLAIDEDGGLWQLYQQIQQYPNLPEMVSVQGGGSHHCALDSAGGLWCWGHNSNGQVGDGSRDYRWEPVQIGLPAAASEVAVGTDSSCVLLVDGRVMCWGRSDYFGVTPPVNQLTPILIPEQENIAHIWSPTSSGNARTFFSQNNAGTLFSFGADLLGRQRQDETIAGPTDASTIAYGLGQIWLLDSERRLWRWGNNEGGFLLGPGEPKPARPVAHRVANLRPAQKVVTGGQTSCALLRDQSVACWGGNESYGFRGQTENRDQSLPPNTVAEIGSSQWLSAGAYHACSVDSGGQAHCWGLNHNGSLGNGSNRRYNGAAVEVRNLTSLTQTAAGYRHSCALTTAGQMHCWGDNQYGQTGGVPGEATYIPAALQGLPAVRSLAAGLNHSCALGENDQLYCWGGDALGQLAQAGPFGETQRTNAPQLMPGLNNIQSVDVNFSTTCALRQSGVLVCWGDHQDEGAWIHAVEADEADPFNRNLVAMPAIPEPIRQVAVAKQSACVRLESGAVRCWGQNRFGQLGDGGFEPRKAHAVVSNLPPIIDIDAGYYSVCAVAETGAVYCWGANSSNQLGDGFSTSSYTLPRRVVGY